MLKLGIIGYPLEHSLSPVMHTAALNQLNIMGEYKAYETKPDKLEKEFKKLKTLGIKGLNVTIPFKTKIVPLLDKLDSEAKLANAVNTIIFKEDGRTIGSNTDLIGFWESIPESFRKKTKSSKVVVIGYGGSSRAACISFIKIGVKELRVYGRDKQRLDEFLMFLKEIKKTFKSNSGLKTDHIENIILSDINILTNTTSIGMQPNINESPVTKDKLSSLPKESLVYDIIYNPPETKLLKYAKELNLNTLNGLEMLARQGSASLSIWLGKEVSAYKTMKQALTSALSQTATNKP